MFSIIFSLVFWYNLSVICVVFALNPLLKANICYYPKEYFISYNIICLKELGNQKKENETKYMALENVWQALEERMYLKEEELKVEKNLLLREENLKAFN